MMLGLNSGTGVALLLMWASCVVTALHLPDEKLSLAKVKVVVCTNNSDCRPFQECLEGVCSPARPIPVGLKCTDDTDCRGHRKCCDGVCRKGCEEVEIKCINDIYCPHRLKCCDDGVCRMACEKPGPALCCPQNEPGHLGVCAELCEDNDDCPGGELCCSNGCGHECTISYKNCTWIEPLTVVVG
ncbi:uncharacterized protein LOC143018265 isoform X2 [Oratosquilla oratoria]|uniref:uncharacterized protein LOC143018265 isoform X2 n=1 Tax=Oratosquilla oratoria TaxID=337810 RepID=UPI003F768F7D